jgi:hypothetical protein
MKNSFTTNHSSFTRLQRPALLPKVAFWSFLAALFFSQQIATAFAQETQSALQAAPSINPFAPEFLISFAAVIAIGIVAVWLVWDRARMTQR